MIQCSDLIGLVLFWWENVNKKARWSPFVVFKNLYNLLGLTAMSSNLPFTAFYLDQSSVPPKTGFTVILIKQVTSTEVLTRGHYSYMYFLSIASRWRPL